MSNHTIHILWGELAVSLYRRGVIDNTVRLAHAVYDFRLESEASAFLLGVTEARRPHEWAQVTRLTDQRALGMPLRARLIDAILRGDADQVEEILKSGVSPETRAPGGMNALQLAAKEGRPDIAQALLAHGAPAEEPPSSPNPYSALHLAASSPNPDAGKVIDVIAERNVDLDRSDSYGRTALLCAIEQANALCATRLIVHGARVDIPGEDGKTARQRFNAVFGATTGQPEVDELDQQLFEAERAAAERAARLSAQVRKPSARPRPVGSA